MDKPAGSQPVVLGAANLGGRLFWWARRSSRPTPVGLDQLLRLDRATELIEALGHDASGARRLLFSRSGFTAELRAGQRQRPEVALVALDELFSSSRALESTG